MTSREKGWLAGLVILTILALVELYNIPGTSRILLELNNAGHLLVFGILAVAALHLFKIVRPALRQKPWAAYVLAFGTASFLGFASELVQYYSPRDASLEDLARDVIGAASFLALYAAVRDPDLQSIRSARPALRGRLLALTAYLWLLGGWALLFWSSAFVHVTIDAAGWQRENAETIIDGGGDYIFALKGNQGTLHQQVQDHVLGHMENDFADVPARKYETVVKGHGRVDTLTYYQMPVPDAITNQEKWKGLKTIGVAIRISEEGGKATSDVRYYISSTKTAVRRFAERVRGHWGIENSLHWCLEVTFREDESRLRDRHAAENVAWLKRFAISILKQQTDKATIAMRRRMAGWNPEYLMQVLGLPQL